MGTGEAPLPFMGPGTEAVTANVAFGSMVAKIAAPTAAIIGRRTSA
jgi:hypothetical protein